MVVRAKRSETITIWCRRFALILGCVLAPSFVGTAAAQDVFFDLTQSSVQHITLPISQSATIGVSESIGELLIADPNIADAQPVTDRSIYVIGKALGTTTINVFSPEKEPLGLLEIEVGVDTADLQRAINEVAPYADVQASSINGRLRLSGSVTDTVTMARIVEVASQYGSDNIINAITLKTGQQVNLEVRILEASHDAGRELGIGIEASAGPFTVTSGDNSARTQASFSSFITNIIGGGVSIDLIINALETKGLVRKLAEPNLTTLSGQEAKFLAGGEYPIRTVDKEGNIALEYKEVGVRLRFIPVVLGKDRIQIEIAPEVSEVLDFTPAGDPIITTRNLSSTIELRDGQSFSVAGLLQASSVKKQNQVPWLGQIPVLGTLFRSSSFQKEDTELVVIVTPRLVQPSIPGQVPATPLDLARNSNDAEFFLLGQLEVTKDMIREFEQGADIVGPFGHIIDLDSDGMVYVKP